MDPNGMMMSFRQAVKQRDRNGARNYAELLIAQVFSGFSPPQGYTTGKLLRYVDARLARLCWGWGPKRKIASKTD